MLEPSIEVISTLDTPMGGSCSDEQLTCRPLTARVRSPLSASSISLSSSCLSLLPL
jgi:hypothetical protein